jgi:hypothetical protein
MRSNRYEKLGFHISNLEKAQLKVALNFTPLVPSKKVV